MDNSSLRGYQFLNEDSNDQYSRSKKRRRSSITNDYTQFSSNNQDLISNQNLSMTTNRKRSAEDDLITYSTQHLFRDHEQSVRRKKVLTIELNIYILFRYINELVMNIRIVLN